MCRPEHFAVSYTINPWMDPQSWARERARARRGIAAGVDRRCTATLDRARRERSSSSRRCRGCRISSSPPTPRWCSTARCCWRASAIPSASARSRISRRRSAAAGARPGRCDADAARGRRARRRRRLRVGRDPQPVLDGLRPALRCRRARTPSRTRSASEAIALELADERFYHMDTALCPLPGGEVMYLSRGVHAGGPGRDPRARPAGRSASRSATDDARRLAANAVCLGNTLVLSGCSEPPARPARGARLPRGGDAARLVPAQRRQRVLPDAAARSAVASHPCHRSCRGGMTEKAIWPAQAEAITNRSGT